MYAVKSGDSWLEDKDGRQRAVSKSWRTPYGSFLAALGALAVPATWVMLAKYGVPEIVDLEVIKLNDLAMLHSRVAGFSGHLGDGIGALRESLLVALEELQGRRQLARMRASVAAREAVARCLEPLPPRCHWQLPIPTNEPVLHMGSATETLCDNLGVRDGIGGTTETSTCADCDYVVRHTMAMHEVATELVKNASPEAHLTKNDKREALMQMCAMVMSDARAALANRITSIGTASCAP